MEGTMTCELSTQLVLTIQHSSRELLKLLVVIVWMLTIKEAVEFDQQVIMGILHVLQHESILKGLWFGLGDEVPLRGQLFSTAGCQNQ